MHYLKTTPAYFNDHDPGAAAWLRELIKRGLIADGEVDDRSILDVSPDDIRGFTQCHFFAGIGGWSYALRLAGWDDARPVWTGSPPCQPFSAAGKQLGRDDPRHLAPHFIGLVRACRPGVLFGEQVASAEVFGRAPKRARDGAAPAPQWAWLDDLSDRLEAARYAVGASDIPAAGVGAFHIRQRTFFVAVAHEWLEHASRNGRIEWGAEPSQRGTSVRCGTRGLADLHGNGCSETGRGQPEAGCDGPFGDSAAHKRLADAEGSGLHEQRRATGCPHDAGRTSHAEQPADSSGPDRPGPSHGIWDAPDWLLCRDGKWRPAQSSVFGVADEIPAELVRSGAFVPASFPLAPKAKGDARRVMRLRGYGNAIVPQVAAEFIRASEEAIREVMGVAA